MRTPTRIIILPAVAGLVLAACSAAGAGSPAPASPEASAAPAVATPHPTAKEITPAPATPLPTTDGEGDEAVSGYVTDVVQSVLETSTVVGDVTQVRDGVIVATHTASDPRATGKSKVAFSVDWYGNSGPVWATMTLTTADGTWSGPCAGATVTEGTLGSMSCWLAGSGAYEGWTYYQASSPGGGAMITTEGIIYKGEAPDR